MLKKIIPMILSLTNKNGINTEEEGSLDDREKEKERFKEMLRTHKHNLLNRKINLLQSL